MYPIPRYCDLDGVAEICPLLEGVTLRMEIYVNGQRTVTSPVQSLRVERADFGADQCDSIGSGLAEMSASGNH